MNQLNSIILEGNITRDIEMQKTANGFNACTIPIAVNRWYKDSNNQVVTEVSFFDIEVFGKMADYCEKHVAKGRGVRVVGRLKQSRWKLPTGKSGSRITIIAEHIEFKPQLTKKEDSQEEAKNIAEATMAATSEENDFEEENVVF